MDFGVCKVYTRPTRNNGKMIILSDLHLGSNRNYLYNLNRWLKKENKDQEVVLLGDTFDDYKKRFLTYDDLVFLERVREFNSVHIFPGNHDAQVFRNHSHHFASYCGKMHCNLDNLPVHLTPNILALHGDHWDRTNPILMRCADVVYDLMLANNRTGYGWIKQLAKRRCINSFLKNAKILFEEKPEVDYILVGHLHQQQSWELLPGKTLVCSGCFVEEETFLTVQGKTITMRRF